MKGRPRLSDEEKKRRGTFKPSRGSGDEIKDVVIINGGEPKFELSGEARDLFDSVCKTMIAYRSLAEVDITTISMMCVEFDTYMDCLGKGIVDVSADGSLKPSAYYTIREKSMKNMMMLAKDLGVTPLIRMKMRPNKDDKQTKDKASKFLQPNTDIAG